MSVVRFTLELAGDVSSFTPSVQAEISNAIAAQAGVAPSAVELTITPGSVIVGVSIQTYAATAAAMVKAEAVVGRPQRWVASRLQVRRSGCR